MNHVRREAEPRHYILCKSLGQEAFPLTYLPVLCKPKGLQSSYGRAPLPFGQEICTKDRFILVECTLQIHFTFFVQSLVPCPPFCKARPKESEKKDWECLSSYGGLGTVLILTSRLRTKMYSVQLCLQGALQVIAKLFPLDTSKDILCKPKGLQSSYGRAPLPFGQEICVPRRGKKKGGAKRSFARTM